MTDYDKTYSSSSSSYTESVSNVKDKYTSVGQGIRFEGGLVFYLEEHVGLFVQSGYSYDNESAKMTYKSDSYEYASSQSVKFSCISTSVGLHFRIPEGILKPYGGVGAGIFFLNNFIIMYDEKGYGHVERERKYTSNNPVGYSGYFGINVDLGSSVALFVEGKTTLVSFYISKIELTKYVVDGQERLSSMNTKDKIIEFEENKNFTRVTPGDENQPENGGAPSPCIANSIDVMIGISIIL
jgi:hypothetical protein